MSSKEFNEVIKGTMWSFMSTVIVNAGGFLFWVIVGMLVNIRELGFITTAVSLSNLLSGLANIGLNYAVLRETPVRGSRAFVSSTILGLILAILISLSSLLFRDVYSGFSGCIPFIMILTVLGVIATISNTGLIVSKKYKFIFFSNLLATLTKFAIGIGLILVGWSIVGVLLSYISFRLTLFVVSFLVSVSSIGLSLPTLRDFAETVRIGISNYPLMLSNILTLNASTILVAVLSSSPISTGIYYMCLVIVSTLASIPSIMSLIGLPISVKSSKIDIMDEILRIGGSVIVPLVVFVGGASDWILGMINKGLMAGFPILTLLTFSIIPQVMISVSISKLNYRKNLRQITVIGLTQLLILILASVMLIPLYGLYGIVFSYILSKVIPLVLIIPQADFIMGSKLFLIQAIFISIAFLLSEYAPSILISIFMSICSLLTILLLKIVTPQELLGILKECFRTIL